MGLVKFYLHFSKTHEAYRAGYLISSFIQHTLSNEEEEELDEFILSSDENMQVFEDLTEEGTAGAFVIWFGQHVAQDKLELSKKPLKFKKKWSLKEWYKSIFRSQSFL